eukprot:6202687-Pleurochrysis_carterae.AAC.4
MVAVEQSFTQFGDTRCSQRQQRSRERSRLSKCFWCLGQASTVAVVVETAVAEARETKIYRELTVSRYEQGGSRIATKCKWACPAQACSKAAVARFRTAQLMFQQGKRTDAAGKTQLPPLP